MENNNQGCSLRIVEWNINKLSPKNTDKQGIIKKYIFDEVKPDILILTECGASFNKCDNFKQLPDSDSSNWKIFFSKENNFNYIAILVNVNNEKIKTVEYLNLQDVFCEVNQKSKIHPDRIAVKIILKNNTYITVLGIRMLTSWYNKKRKPNYPDSNLSPREKQLTQNIQLVKDIQMLNPDIIIGDFNTHTEMETPGFYNVQLEKSDKINQDLQNSWNALFKPPVLNVFCQCISNSEKSYEYWPKDNNSLFSVKAKNSSEGTSAATPDTLIWRSEPSEDDNDKLNPRYYPKIAKGQKPSDVVKDWPSDHCMLIADIKIKLKQ